MIYRLCNSMISKGMTAGMGEKLDVFYAMGKLSHDEYKELTLAITPLNRV